MIVRPFVCDVAVVKTTNTKIKIVKIQKIKFKKTDVRLIEHVHLIRRIWYVVTDEAAWQKL